jgi:DNA-binding SARP family transcriptional activator/tetratricopeptide (TPR) repeat protein
MVPLRVGVLGPVTAWRDGREVPGGQPRQLAVLGVLATRANRLVSRGELVDAVWGDKPPASAEGGIYTYVAGLRRVLEPDRPRPNPGQRRRVPARVLVSAGGGYMLRLGPGCLDADSFEQGLGQARGLRASGDLAGAAQAVAGALSLWRGIAFAGVPGPFAEAERQRLAELRTAAAEEWADLLLALGRPAEAVPDLTTLVAEHPLRERARGLLMTALYRCGRQADALQVFHEARERLAEDLGIDPGGELTHIHRQVLTMDPALDGPAEPAAVALVASSPQAPQSVQALPPVQAPPAQAPQSAQALPAQGVQSARPPAQVPPEAAGFAGRATELRRLHAMLPAAAGGLSIASEPTSARGTPARSGAPGEASPAVAVITGTAGIGKTTLAIRFARQVASRFPDGQLYANLRGFDPSGTPIEPGDALRYFFEALGVPPRQVPGSFEAQTGLFRSLLEGKRMLLLLDNARSTDQVRPLLPGSPGCMVIITSRSQLAGLIAAEGARPLPLDVLSLTDATELLAARLGEERIAAEPAAAAELIRQSAGLPLALSVTCARAITRPGLSLADLAAELRDARVRLDVLDAGDVTTDLRAVFSWSYERLSDGAARMFRLLGLHPGPDVSAPAAASLAGVPLAQARAALAELTRASLLAEDTVGRFMFHDLLRAYAAERVAAADGEDEQDVALRRLLDYYLRSSCAGTRRMYPALRQIAPPAGLTGVVAEEFGSYEQALAWFVAEQRVLLAAVTVAAERAEDTYCWQLARSCAPVMHRRGLLHDVAGAQRAALAAAERLGDPMALGYVHYDLGHVHGRLGNVAEADAHLEQALEMFTQTGDRANIGQVQHGLALLLTQQGRYAEGLPHALEGLRLRRSFGDRAMVGMSENAVGWIYGHLAQYDEALRHCRRALELLRECGSRSGAADTLDSMAFAYAGLGDHERAMAHYQQALEAYRQIGDPDGESSSLTGLGDAQFALGLHVAARHSWELALAALARLPSADTRRIRDRLAQLPAAGDAATA